MLRPQSLFSFNGKRKNDLRLQTNVLDEGDVVRRVPVQGVPQLGEGDAVHQGVNGADHLQGQDVKDDFRLKLFTGNGAI